jgi:hypothetical protein
MASAPARDGVRVYPVAWPIDQQVPPLAAAMKHYPSLGSHGTGWPDWWPEEMKVHAAVGDSPTSKARSLKHYATAPFDDGKRAIAGRLARILVSFVYDAERIFPRLMAEQGVEASELDMMLDSGAFTVWTKEDVIDLDAYIAWAQAYRAEVPNSRIVNLDVIPGRPGREPSMEQREEAARLSMANADTMRSAGLDICEVFHWFEDWAVLDELVARRRPGEVIGIGGLAGQGGGEAKRAFVSQVFARARDRYGGWSSLIPFHGFGIAPDSPLARLAPWYSIDASSWLSPARFGQAVGRGGERMGDDSRTSIKEVSAVYLERVLLDWRRLEDSYTRLWTERGIRFVPDVEEAPCPS